LSESRPVGPLVDAGPARRPERRELKGRFVTLAPLDAEAHGEALFAGAGGHDLAHLWAYMGDGPYLDRAAFDASLRLKSKSEDPLFFAILDNATGRALGYQTLMRIDLPNRVVEVGNILYGAPMQRTTGATEAQCLLARHVFEDLGFRRYEWKCNALNAPSRRAALRYGFVFEGVFRQHMIVKGRNRDTAWFAILDSEWPALRAAFDAWLRPDNFGADGRQKARLAEIRARPGG
jgi:RimJ/RimL family protein N-acetyltransferase